LAAFFLGLKKAKEKIFLSNERKKKPLLSNFIKPPHKNHKSLSSRTALAFDAERRSREKMSALSSRRVSVHVPGGGGTTKAAFSRRSAFFSGMMRPLHRTAVKKSSSSSRRPKNAGRRRMISSSSSRDLFEGDEGFDVVLLQKDLVEEGLLDQKHANGYVKEFRYLSFSSFSQRPKNLIFEPLLCWCQQY
jgi:hypothetical protein